MTQTNGQAGLACLFACLLWIDITRREGINRRKSPPESQDRKNIIVSDSWGLSRDIRYLPPCAPTCSSVPRLFTPPCFSLPTMKLTTTTIALAVLSAAIPAAYALPAAASARQFKLPTCAAVRLLPLETCTSPRAQLTSCRNPVSARQTARSRRAHPPISGVCAVFRRWTSSGMRRLCSRVWMGSRGGRCVRRGRGIVSFSRLYHHLVWCVLTVVLEYKELLKSVCASAQFGSKSVEWAV